MFRVGFIVDKCEPMYVGGYENRFFNLASRLGASDEVRVYTSLDTKVLQRQTFRFDRISTTSFQRDKSGQRSISHSLIFSISVGANPFQTWTPDVVVVEAIPYFHLACMAPWITRIPAVKILNVEEAWFSYPYLKGLLARPSSIAIRWLLRAGLRQAEPRA